MWLTVKEASKLYRFKRSTLYLWVEKSIIPHYRVGKLVRFKSEEVDEWLNKYKKEVGTKVDKAPREPLDISTFEANNIIRKAVDDVKGLKV